MPGIADNRATIREFFRRATDGGDMLALLAEDAMWFVPGDWALAGSYDKEGIAKVFERVGALFGEPLQLTILNMTAEEDRVAVEAISHCAFKDGGSYDNRYHYLFRLRDGLIVEAKEYFDTGYMEKLVALRPEMRPKG